MERAERYATISSGGIKLRYLITFLALISAVVFATVDLNFWLDVDYFVFDATPSSTVSIYGAQLDIVFPSPGNVSMGFGVEGGYVTADASFLEMDYTNSVGIYAVGVYKSPLTSVFDFVVVSRGGISIPSMDMSKMGYFTEVSVGIIYPLGKSFWISLASAMKSYSFGNPYVTFIPIKLGIGGEL